MADLIPYNQHFIHVAEVLGGPEDQVVFLYFWDMHCIKVRLDQPAIIRFSYSEIGSQRRMDYRTVKKSAKHLEAIGLISIDKDLCTVNAKRYIALASCFCQLSDKESVDEFLKAVDERDDALLRSYGFDENVNEKEIILRMKGSSANLQVDLQNCSSTNKNVGQPTNLYADLQKCCSTYKNAGQPTNLSVDLQNCINQLDGIMLEILQISDLQKCSSTYKNVGDILQKCRYDLQKCRTENKEKKINTENNVGEAKLPYIGGDFVEGNESVGEGENSQDEFKIDLPRTSQVNMDDYHIYKLRKRTPYYHPDEISRIINDPEYCAESPARIFINILWEDLTVLCSSDRTDEDGNIIMDGLRVDPEGQILPVDLVDHGIMDAYEDTLAVMERGYIEYRGVKFPVEKKEFNPESMDLIVEWVKEQGANEEYYRLTSRTLHNLDAPQLPEEGERNLNRREAVQVDRERDKAYQREILSLGLNNDTIDDLTPIEYVAYLFMKDNYNLSQDHDVEDPQDAQFLRRSDLVIFYNEIKGEGVTEEDFLGILFNNKVDENGCLSLKTPRVFSSRAIEKWNTMHGMTSKIQIS